MKNNVIKLIFPMLILFSIFYFLFSFVTFAANPLDAARTFVGVDEPPITQLKDILDPTAKTGTLATIINWLIGIFWIMAIGFVVWAAFTFLFADGDETKIGEAKNRLKYALIAAIVAALATGIDVIVYYLLKGNIY